MVCTSPGSRPASPTLASCFSSPSATTARRPTTRPSRYESPRLRRHSERASRTHRNDPTTIHGRHTHPRLHVHIYTRTQDTHPSHFSAAYICCCFRVRLCLLWRLRAGSDVVGRWVGGSCSCADVATGPALVVGCDLVTTLQRARYGLL